ncbi:type I-E CRISPR-associated endonuclease Cas1e [Umezawaea sp. Da 62-37]|uniref:type I-E CRISPR-associated endonuclease Cas1e n=1 Tax=Umezawaea sp. Da 62-37 TaxID=3075927 RepID=UPI0028F6ECD5|nr:type I-E CRISPR-associated endonuclease Cas1e [Umezawaea sp. Da 62-37]WNV92097.1 type I-E CRISPR-associated endonuclease Cas1e [Umezawaea sp. Da 62-37]
MWWQNHPHDLHRVTDRVSSVYAERTHVDRADNAIVLINKERTVRVPAAMIAVVLLGPGTRITHAAMRLLGDSGTAVCWVGQHGVRMYASGQGASRGTHLLLRQAWLVTRPTERLAVARRMYDMRFPDEDTAGLTMQQLRGREGTRVKKLYKQHSLRTGVAWTRREYKAGDAFAAGDDVNRVLSAANSALYGICHAVIVGLGASPGLGFVHTGSATSFVMDIADLYKAELTIPLAFDLTAQGLIDERDARTALRDRIVDTGLLHRVVDDVKSLLFPDGEEPSDNGANELWDEELGTVSGGVNWSSDLDGRGGEHMVVIGPEFDEIEPEQVDF